MKLERAVMKALKIENSQGYFLAENGTYKTVDKIDKTVLLNLVNRSLENGFVMDEYNEETLQNQAHQIIYKSIGEKLSDLHMKRNEFKDESDRLFLEAYKKYK
jgi:cell division septal protein FtsQ